MKRRKKEETKLNTFIKRVEEEEGRNNGRKKEISREYKKTKNGNRILYCKCS